jgi:tripartite-type tricarboxylate transporter receptor subunit TctC
VSAISLTAVAQTAYSYPSKMIRLVTASAASQTEIVACIVGAKMKQGLGQPVVIENRAGAGGAIGAHIVAKATPDGSYGLMAPAKTPRFILHQLGNEVRRVLELPDVKEQLRIIGFVPAPSTPETLDKILRADIEIFTKVAKMVGLRAQKSTSDA